MSEIKVNKITPRVACGTTQLGDSGDTFTIPSGATITNAGTASGFGATGETSWDTTVKTTGTFTATAGVGYFLNTTGGIITVNLAAGTAGDSVALADYAGTWQTNNVTVAANGTEKIGGVDADITLSTEGQSVTFVYIDGTQGWVNVLDSTSNVRGATFVTATGGTPCSGAISGNCKIHTFTGPGTFCVSAIATCGANNVVSYMVIAGGGSGGTVPTGNATGGGGAGGFREYKSSATPYTASPLDGNPCGTAITVSASPYAITVGGGGASVCSGNTNGNNGNPSTFSTITSTAGGYGASYSPVPGVGGPGGSGGGGSGGARDKAGGTGNTPPTTPAQGFAGGTSATPPAPDDGPGGGGGGATVVGTSGTAANGPGGAGATTEISASSVVYSGGGGAAQNPNGPGGTGGAGGGGAGGTSGTAGTVNTGGGGGGAGTGANPSGQGGSGVVILRYKFQ